MAFDNTNTGFLSRNDRKEKDTHPDFKGTINVDGIDYWLDGWTKEGKAGGKMEGKRFFSLSVKRKDGQAPTKSAAPAADLSDSDVPF